MTAKQRKLRDKERFKASVIKQAYRLIKEGGIEGLSLRKLAAAIEYSTMKLYHEFGSKEDILLFLADDICRRQNEKLLKIDKKMDPEEYLLRITDEAVRFYVNEPSSAAILASARFGTHNKEFPPTFKASADHYRQSVLALDLPIFSNPERLDECLNVTRALLLGALSLLNPDSDEKVKNLVIKIVNDGLMVILAGWKSLH